MHHILSLIIVFMIALTACGQSIGSSQPRPDSTDAVLDYQRYCHYWFWEFNYRWEQEFYRCVREGNDQELCEENWNTKLDENTSNWYKCLDDLPMVSQDCRMQLNHEDHEQDTDGDGISDYMESWMSLNPCEVCSYAGVPGIDCDADLDFDGDGIPNGEDLDPGCSSGTEGFEGCLF